MKPEIDYTLYLITDRKLMSTQTLEQCVEQAIQGGCTLVQLREKDATSREFYNMAVTLRQVTARLHVPLIINDRVDIALAVDADGVHVGQSDLPAAVARRLMGEDKIVGVSAGNLALAQAAQADRADYIGVGAMFATGTKTDARATSIEELRRIRQTVALPIVAIGGITHQTAPLLCGTGIDGLAVVSAIVSQPNITKAAQDLKQLFVAGTKWG